MYTKDADRYLKHLKEGMVTIGELVDILYVYEIKRGERIRRRTVEEQVRRMPMATVYSRVARAVADTRDTETTLD